MSCPHALSTRPCQLLIHDLPMKIHTTTLFQLRTGYLIFNDHLHKIAKVNSRDCEDAATDSRSYFISSFTAPDKVASVATSKAQSDTRTCASMCYSLPENHDHRSWGKSRIQTHYKAHFWTLQYWSCPITKIILDLPAGRYYPRVFTLNVATLCTLVSGF